MSDRSATPSPWSSRSVDSVLRLLAMGWVISCMLCLGGCQIFTRFRNDSLNAPEIGRAHV